MHPWEQTGFYQKHSVRPHICVVATLAESDLAYYARVQQILNSRVQQISDPADAGESYQGTTCGMTMQLNHAEQLHGHLSPFAPWCINVIAFGCLGKFRECTASLIKCESGCSLVTTAKHVQHAFYPSLLLPLLFFTACQ